MSEALYMEDSYLKEITTTIKNVNEKFVVLQETIFYPSSGGQPNDTGFLVKDDKKYRIINVLKKEGEIVHELEHELEQTLDLKVNDSVKAIIDWDRRYALMKAHTATHVLCCILHKETGALITGNQLYEDRIRVDFNLDDYDKDLLVELVEKANQQIKNNLETKSYFLPREEAFKIPGALKLANILPPSISILRIVEIQGLDVQVDGGTHVKNTSEIGLLKFSKAENKGKNNRRLVVEIK